MKVGRGYEGEVCCASNISGCPKELLYFTSEQGDLPRGFKLQVDHVEPSNASTLKNIISILSFNDAVEVLCLNLIGSR